MAARKHQNGSAAEVEAAFYDALNRADPQAREADDPVDADVGHRAIRDSWSALLEHGGLQIRPSQLHETHNLMSSVHTVIEGVTASSGEPAHLIATNVYVKTPKGWRIVLHHVSVAPGPVPVDPRAQILH